MTLPDFPLSERELAAQRFRQAAARLRGAALECARAILDLKRTGAHFREGAASVREFAERNGLSWSEARMYENLARAIESDASIAEEVRKGTISAASAAVLGEVTELPEASRKPDDRWVEWAKTMDSRKLRRLLEERRDEARAGEPVIPVSAYVTPAVRDDMWRARVLSSRPTHVVLTMGQTIGIVFADWLDQKDPLRKTPGTRRLPDTSTLPGERYVPAAVDRAVRAVNQDKCVVPMCDQRFWVERAHRVPHRDGSGRETGNLDLLCDYHNWLNEDGFILVTGPADAPIVTDMYGRPLSERRPSPFWGEVGGLPIIPSPRVQPLPPDEIKQTAAREEQPPPPLPP